MITFKHINSTKEVIVNALGIFQAIETAKVVFYKSIGDSSLNYEIIKVQII